MDISKGDAEEIDSKLILIQSTYFKMPKRFYLILADVKTILIELEQASTRRVNLIELLTIDARHSLWIWEARKEQYPSKAKTINMNMGSIKARLKNMSEHGAGGRR